jgi:hypothetical protein
MAKERLSYVVVIQNRPKLMRKWWENSKPDRMGTNLSIGTYLTVVYEKGRVVRVQPAVLRRLGRVLGCSLLTVSERKFLTNTFL